MNRFQLVFIFRNPLIGIQPVRSFCFTNRDVNSLYTQFAQLKKIQYPTGGITLYEFENNYVYSSYVPIKIKDTSVTLLGNGTGQGEHAEFERIFTVNVPASPGLNGDQGGAYANIQIGNIGCDISGGANVCANLTLQGLDAGNSSINFSVLSNIFDRYLPNGSYKMKAVFNQAPPAYGNFFFNIEWKKADSQFVNQQPAGGLRVKKITSRDSVANNDIVRVYQYDDDSAGLSSGRYFSTAFSEFTEYISSRQYTQVVNDCLYCDVQLLQRTSSSNITQVTHSGSFSGYTKVTVLEGATGQNGKTVYRFSAEADNIVASFPYPPSQSREQRRGLLLEMTEYKKSGTAYWPVKKVTNTYAEHFNTTLLNNSVAFALKMGSKDLVTVNCLDQQQPPPPYYITAYNEQVDGRQLAVGTEKIYNPDDTTKFIQTITKNTYSDTRLLVKTVKKYESNGDSTEIVYNYPNDLSLTGDAETARTGLISQNRVSAVLQQIKKINTVQKELSQTNFKQFSAGKYEPNTLEWQKGSNSKEVRIVYAGYDSYGNVKEQYKANDAKQSYIWGYESNYPIAEVINAPADRIAYTSFESQDYGGWSLNSGGIAVPNNLITGKKSYSGGVNKTVPTGDYIVTAWAYGNISVNSQAGATPLLVSKRNSSWRLFEWKLTNVSSIQVTADNMDEVRLYPAGAQMTTYTYDPLVGLTGKCDVNNRVTIYEYDDFNRLVLVRDQDYNVLKKLCYNFSGQTENCAIYYNTLQDGTYTKQCSSGYVGTSATYSVPAGTYGSSTSQAAANAKATADIQANGQAYANTVGSCYLYTTCTFNLAPGYTSPYNNISNTNNTVTFNLVFYPTGGSMTLGNTYTVAAISSGCRPPGSPERTLNLTSGSRTFQVKIYSTGSMTVKLTAGPDVLINNTVSLAGSYDTGS